MTAPLFTKIDSTGIAPMHLADGQRQAFLGMRNGDQVDMIRHQAPCQDINLALLAPFGHQDEISKVVVVAEKCLLTTVSTLGDVMRVARGNDRAILAMSYDIRRRKNVKIKYTVPGIAVQRLSGAGDLRRSQNSRELSA